MTVRNREFYQILVKDRLFNVNKVIEQAVKVKNSYRARMAELNSDSMSLYSADYKAKLKEEARQALTTVNAELYASLTPKLEDLKAALEESHAYFDLENPALTNALNLISLGGASLDAETVNKINSQFHDQASLRVLQGIYKAQGVLYDGGLDKQIYDVETSLQDVSTRSYNALMLPGGSLNNMASAVGKIAKLEGYDFETLPDPEGFDEAARFGAGLPAKEE